MSHYDEEHNLPEGEQLRREKILVENLYNKRVKDRNGHHVGPVGDIFLDDVHGQPEWITVRSGFMGMKVHFLPVSALEDANEDELIAPWEKDVIHDSPSIKVVNGALSKEQELELFRYYNVDFMETPDGEEVLDRELVEAEEAGDVNAPDAQFHAEDGEGEDLVAIQEHISEERRENLANGDGDHLMDQGVHELPQEDFDARDPEPLREDDPENPLRAQEVVTLEDAPEVEEAEYAPVEEETVVVEDHAFSQGESHGEFDAEGDGAEMDAVEALERDETGHENPLPSEESLGTVTPVPPENLVITRVEDGSVVHQGEYDPEVEERRVHGAHSGETLEERDDSLETYQPRHLRGDDGK